MHGIYEIPLQNMQDVWSKLYVYMGKSLVDICGRAAKGAIRKAIRNMTTDLGKDLRRQHNEQGIPTDLCRLYHYAPWFFRDPRFVIDLLRRTEQERIWEVRICPLANMWNKSGVSEIGKLFCEEYQHGLLNGYTDGKGQMNLSKLLTCERDIQCSFACYYRLANIDGNEAPYSFPETQWNVPDENKLISSQSLNELCIKSYCYLLDTAAEYFGAEGINGVVMGLREVAPVMCADLARQADHTKNPLDEAFVEYNFPMKLNTQDEPLWNAFPRHGAKELFQLNLLDVIKACIQ